MYDLPMPTESRVCDSSWPRLSLLEGILRESAPITDSLILWLPCERVRSSQFWERIHAQGRPESVGQGIAAIKATCVPARQPIGYFRRFLQKLRGSSENQQWMLPDGHAAEQWAPRRNDFLLVCPGDSERYLDECRIRARWPEANRIQKIAESWFLVGGITSETPQRTQVDPPQLTGCPHSEAEAMLTTARKAGNRHLETAALTDLGVMALTEGDATGAIGRLEEALAIASELGDHGLEGDILGNLGVAILGLGQTERACQLFETQLAYAREMKDLFAEKNALERLGFAYSRRNDPNLAVTFFEQALTIARATGDRHHQGTLFWNVAIEYAQLDQRDLALTMARLAIDLKRKMGQPDAEAFQNHLASYLSGSALSEPQQDFAISMIPVPPRRSPLSISRNWVSDPDLLRKAASAAKAASKFLRSGFKTVPREVREQRLRTCSGCVHHTGLRCKVCGCFTTLKTTLPYEQCPLGKWTE